MSRVGKALEHRTRLALKFPQDRPAHFKLRLSCLLLSSAFPAASFAVSPLNGHNFQWVEITGIQVYKVPTSSKRHHICINYWDHTKVALQTLIENSQSPSSLCTAWMGVLIMPKRPWMSHMWGGNQTKHCWVSHWQSSRTVMPHRQQGYRVNFKWIWCTARRLKWCSCWFLCYKVLCCVGSLILLPWI